VTLSIRWIVFCLALLGLMLASLQHLWERRREIKTMHVLGFSPQEIVGAHVVESGAVCALPVIVGLIGGGGLGWGLTTLVNPRSFGWSLDFSLSLTPLLLALAFIVSVAVVVGCATSLFLRRILKEATLSDE
jgi:putative ABC transport system permease protein